MTFLQEKLWSVSEIILLNLTKNLNCVGPVSTGTATTSQPTPVSQQQQQQQQHQAHTMATLLAKLETGWEMFNRLLDIFNASIVAMI